MNDSNTVGFPIGVKATGIITNPWYLFPSHTTVVNIGGPNPTEDPIEITPCCQVELPKHGIRMFFEHDCVAFVFIPDYPRSGYLVNPIRDFFAYKTFINYNLYGPFWPLSDDHRYAVVDVIRFGIKQLIRVETEWREGDAVVSGFYHDSKDTHIDLSVADLSQYLTILNRTLYYAIAFYLIGCENVRYFLVEYFKAVESIEHAFGGENKLLDQLKSFGVRKSDYKTFKGYCNDARSAPLDIARHAPEPDAPLYSVDLRNLLADPRSSQVFEFSTLACRQVIDSYIAFLKENSAT
jgi:hypothetical protein